MSKVFKNVRLIDKNARFPNRYATVTVIENRGEDRVLSDGADLFENEVGVALEFVPRLISAI
jgi:hypothetical protein